MKLLKAQTRYRAYRCVCSGGWGGEGACLFVYRSIHMYASKCVCDCLCVCEKKSCIHAGIHSRAHTRMARANTHAGAAACGASLHLVAQRGEFELVWALLARGAEVNWVNSLNQTALHLVTRCGLRVCMYVYMHACMYPCNHLSMHACQVQHALKQNEAQTHPTPNHLRRRHGTARLHRKRVVHTSGCGGCSCCRRRGVSSW